jgi:agmatinase
MRRVAELVGYDQVMEIGVRSASAEEYAVIKDQIRIYDAEMLRQRGVEAVLEEIEEGAEKTYLSIDIDVLDPSIAPGVENPEPCGISLESLFSLIHGIIERKHVVASDVVELNPKLDTSNGITGINASRIIFELLACYGQRDASHR